MMTALTKMAEKADKGVRGGTNLVHSWTYGLVAFAISTPLPPPTLALP